MRKPRNWDEVPMEGAKFVFVALAVCAWVAVESAKPEMTAALAALSLLSAAALVALNALQFQRRFSKALS